MLVNRTKWSVNLGLAILLTCATAWAQGTDPAGGAAGTGTTKGDDAEMGFAKSSQLTLSEQERQVGNYNSKMKQVQTKVGSKAEGAKADSDIIKLNCVNDKKTKIDANVKVGDDVGKAFKTPAVRNSVPKRNFQFSKITIAHQNTIVLGSEADACIGEDVAYVGKTKVSTEEDSSITKQDTTKTKSDYDAASSPERGPAATAVR